MKHNSIAFALALLFVAPLASAGSGEGHDHAATKSGKATHPAHDVASAAFTALDADKNGQVSRAELPQDHKLSAHFAMLDTDKSDSLSPAEFAKGDGM